MIHIALVNLKELMYISIFAYQQSLPSGEQHSCDVGKRKEHRKKNRFALTFPCKIIHLKTPSEYIPTGYISCRYLKLILNVVT